MRKSKVAMLAVVATPFLFAFGCVNLNALHQLAIHVSELTQWAAAINILTTT